MNNMFGLESEDSFAAASQWLVNSNAEIIHATDAEVLIVIGYPPEFESTSPCVRRR
jgi:hypothetical protein